jgi:hypothetical protein
VWNLGCGEEQNGEAEVTVQWVQGKKVKGTNFFLISSTFFLLPFLVSPAISLLTSGLPYHHNSANC